MDRSSSVFCYTSAASEDWISNQTHWLSSWSSVAFIRFVSISVFFGRIRFEKLVEVAVIQTNFAWLASKFGCSPEVVFARCDDAHFSWRKRLCRISADVMDTEVMWLRCHLRRGLAQLMKAFAVSYIELTKVCFEFAFKINFLMETRLGSYRQSLQKAQATFSPHLLKNRGFENVPLGLYIPSSPGNCEKCSQEWELANWQTEDSCS